MSGFFRHKGVSFRFLLWNIPVFILFILLVCLVIWRMEQKNQVSRMRNTGVRLTEQTAQSLENWIADLIRVAKITANDERVMEACADPGNPEKVGPANAFISAVHAQFPYFENIILAAKMPEGKSIDIRVGEETRRITDGQFFTDTVSGKTIGKGGPGFSYIRAVYDGKEYYISEVYPSLLRGIPIFVISVPVRDSTGRLVGIAALGPQMSFFTDVFVSRMKVGKTGYLLFGDDRGLLIAHPKKEYILKPDVIEKLRPVTEQILSGKTDFRTEFEGMSKVYVARKISIPKDSIRHDWYIVFTQSEEEIAASKVFTFGMILGGMALILLYITVMLFVSRVIVVRPVGRVADRLEEEIRKTSVIAGQMFSASRNLAEGASEQSVSAEKVSSLLEDMISRTAENARSTQEAKNLRKESKNSLKTANESIGDATEAMNRIRSRGEETGKIIKTIDEIAFQTNLLALNAAVEAARAGEVGAGFAVVATEVRNLAQRAAQAAAGTQQLIADTVKEIDTGFDLVEKTGDSFQTALDSHHRLGEVFEKIAAATEDQSLTIEMIGKAVAQTREVTGTNSQKAEEYAAASRNLNAQTETMKTCLHELTALIRGEIQK